MNEQQKIVFHLTHVTQAIKTVYTLLRLLREKKMALF